MIKSLIIITFIVSVFSLGCRRVTIVSDSLISAAEDIIVNGINNTNEENFVYTTELWGGSTAYNNPVNRKIYSEGLVEAFGAPDAVVFSFATNDMNRVNQGEISYEDAVQAFWTLTQQAVQAGAQCIVVLESSHKFRELNENIEILNQGFTPLMDQWFYDMSMFEGENDYLGLNYYFVIADISDEVEADIEKYIGDYIHFTAEGAALAAKAITEALAKCPEGRWVFGESKLKDGVELTEPKYFEYKLPSEK